MFIRVKEVKPFITGSSVSNIDVSGHCFARTN